MPARLAKVGDLWAGVLAFDVVEIALDAVQIAVHPGTVLGLVRLGGFVGFAVGLPEVARGVPVAGGSRLHQALEEASSTFSEVLTREARTTESLHTPVLIGV